MSLAYDQPCQALTFSVVIYSITLRRCHPGSSFVFLQVVGTEKQVQVQWAVVKHSSLISVRSIWYYRETPFCSRRLSHVIPVQISAVFSFLLDLRVLSIIISFKALISSFSISLSAHVKSFRALIGFHITHLPAPSAARYFFFQYSSISSRQIEEYQKASILNYCIYLVSNLSLKPSTHFALSPTFSHHGRLYDPCQRRTDARRSTC